MFLVQLMHLTLGFSTSREQVPNLRCAALKPASGEPLFSSACNRVQHECPQFRRLHGLA